MTTPAQIYEQTLREKGQEAADIAYQQALIPAARQFAQANPPGVSVPSFPGMEPSPSPTSSTIGKREDEDITRAEAGETGDDLIKMEEDILAQTTFGASDAGQKAETALQNSLSKFTAGLSANELAQIESEARVAGAEFAPLISQAIEEKRRQLPKSVIAAGERGGFLSTQFAGAAAVEPIVGDTFAGIGGQLANIEDAYNKAISDLKVRQLQSMETARIAARKAVRTGRKEDLDLARKIFDDAKSDFSAGQKLTRDKADTIAKIREEGRAEAKEKREAEKKEAFFKGSDIVSIMKTLPEGQTISLTDPGTGVQYMIKGISGTDAKIKQYSFTDDKGNVTIVNFDPAANEGKGGVIGTTVIPDVGKSKTPPISIIIGEQQKGALGDASAVLDNATGSDGFVNTEVYAKEREKFIQQTGKPDLFDDTFKRRLNPNDPIARRFLTKAETEQAIGGISPEQEKQLRALGIDQGLIDTAKAAGLSFSDLIGG
mgnify:CR=1 FL=1